MPTSPIELLERVAIAGFCGDVVSRRDEMTRVEADAYAPRAPKVPDHRGKVLEAMAQRPALSGRVLQQHHRLCARPRLECHANRIGDQP